MGSGGGKGRMVGRGSRDADLYCGYMGKAIAETRGRNGQPHGLLAGMRIRIKLIFLHTCFSLVLAAILVLALRPAIAEVVKQAEQHEASVMLTLLLAEAGTGPAPAAGPGVVVRRGTAVQVGLDEGSAERVRSEGTTQLVANPSEKAGVLNAAAPSVVGYDKARSGFVAVTVTLQGARDAVVRLYLLMTIALLAVYGLVAAALELFVLPQHVYGPIRTMLEADAAVQEGRAEQELIPDAAMPSDELGEIMRSRNRSIVAVRRHERDLASALAKLEEVATDLKRKNHLLEMARRNMADADRLASLGLMSAGIAHELNTPLAVLKGLVEKLAAERSGNLDRGIVTANEAALMVRVVGRLERLSESLLDFARVRPPTSTLTAMRPLVDEAWTLVRLDRAVEGKSVEMMNEVPGELHAWCDADRIVQVLVNLLRNGVDALSGAGASGNGANGNAKFAGQKRLTVSGTRMTRESGVGEQSSEQWCAITITDNGPGIDANVLPTLFEPFASTRLDSKGTGLGLAVAEGIVREHGGVILARNRTEPVGETGAVFEVVLPVGGERQ